MSKVNQQQQQRVTKLVIRFDRQFLNSWSTVVVFPIITTVEEADTWTAC